MKKQLLLASVVSTLTLSSAYSNVCDDLESAGSTEEKLTKCWNKFGRSDESKEREAKLKKEKELEEIANNENTKQQKNIEVKKFTQQELNDEGFGKDFFAFQYNYNIRINGLPKEYRLTDGDSLCTYLGYEKATRSEFSGELFGEGIVNKGLIVDKYFFTGNAKKEPELYKEDPKQYTVKKYVSITCARRKDKKLEDSKDLIESMTESTSYADSILGPPISGSNTSVDNSKRDSNVRAIEGKTDHGYQVPDWMKESSSSNSKGL